MKLAVKTLDNKAAGDITLDKDVFGIEPRADIMHRMVSYQLASRRGGNHKVKTISEVSGTGKKPFKQKGTGSARRGSNRRNIDRGGATVHGPVVRSHAIALPKKLRSLALKSALSTKAKEGKIIIIENAVAKTHKTKDMMKAFIGFGLESAVIVSGEEIDANFARATNNLPRIDVLPAQGTNVYDILRRDTLVLTKEAVESLTKRLK
jgi:large subunit ribosomal protein L4